LAELREFAAKTEDAEALAKALKDFDYLTIPLAEAGLAAGLRSSD
jgi:hypothetical protein